MLILRNDQLTLDIADEQGFADWYVDTFMPEHLAVFCDELPRHVRRERVIYGRNKAIEFGFTDPVHQTHFVTLMWDIGPNFYTFPGYKEIVEAIDEPAEKRIDRLYEDLSWEQEKAAILGADEKVWYPNQDQTPAGGH